MWTLVTGFFLNFVASNGLKVAGILLPYLWKAMPFVVLVVACVVGYYHDDPVARWALGFAVVSEFVVGFEVADWFTGK